jgi:hypothetical protein
LSLICPEANPQHARIDTTGNGISNPQQEELKCISGLAPPVPFFTQVLGGVLQRKSKNAGLQGQGHFAVPPIVHDVLRWPGQPLDPLAVRFAAPGKVIQRQPATAKAKRFVKDTKVTLEPFATP